jgi:hypothetical protein
MESKYGCYVLMLSYVDENWMDIGGNIFPIEGFIESKNFERNADIRTGLNGILWGQSSYLPYEKINNGNWVVVKTEVSEDLIKTDHYNNRYKFLNGIIVCSGNLRDAAKYIIKHKNDNGFDEYGSWVQSEEIVGSKEWLKEHCNAGII